MKEVLEKVLTYLLVFGVGGLCCLLAQILIIKTKLTPARILVIFLLAGVALEASGLYEIIYEYARAGISVPIIGFGAALCRNAVEMTKIYGYAGAVTGGIMGASFGLGAAIGLSYLAALLFKPHIKNH